jgi:hypothetical protein
MKTSGESVEGLKITSGGRLLKTKWRYDEEREVGSYVTEDVSEHAPRHYVELYRRIDYDSREPDFQGNTFPAFHGIGKA